MNAFMNFYSLLTYHCFQVHRSSAHQAGVGAIFDRVLSELVSKMKEMKMDKTELGCLRAIVLFNPGGQLVGFTTQDRCMAHQASL